MSRVVFKLYITGGSLTGIHAIKSIEEICANELKNFYQLDIIDVLQHPEIAEADGVFVTPTLVKLSPPPVCQIVGDLSDTKKILQVLKIN